VSEPGQVSPPHPPKKKLDPKHRRRAFAAMLIAAVIFALLAAKWASDPLIYGDEWDDLRISLVSSNAICAILSAGSAWFFRPKPEVSA
jgi:hypothetical protein